MKYNYIRKCRNFQIGYSKVDGCHYLAFVNSNKKIFSSRNIDECFYLAEIFANEKKRLPESISDYKDKKWYNMFTIIKEDELQENQDNARLIIGMMEILGV